MTGMTCHRSRGFSPTKPKTILGETRKNKIEIKLYK